jgi:glycosyltransferase involved in cell wall biosynthesis
MTVSVIIPTYNGAHKIPNILNALAQQTTQDFEVIVVIDGSTDDTMAVLRSLPVAFQELRIIKQPNGGRAKVRNKGAAAAQGNLLIFFDDDMRPNPEAVRQHTTHHAAHPGTILTGGQIEEITPGMPDFVRFKAGLSRKWSQDMPQPGKPLSKDNIFLTAANFSIAKSTFETLGGFDERLTDAEDYDLAVRAAQHGIELFADPGILAWHDDVITCTSYIRRLRQYASAQETLVNLKPEIHGSATKYSVSPPAGLKKMFFSALCSRMLIRSIDDRRWTWLPQNLRYRLYDYVVTANGSYFPQKVRLS